VPLEESVSALGCTLTDPPDLANFASPAVLDSQGGLDFLSLRHGRGGVAGVTIKAGGEFR
jgi:hypothetical protein